MMISNAFSLCEGIIPYFAWRKPPSADNNGLISQIREEQNSEEKFNTHLHSFKLNLNQMIRNFGLYEPPPGPEQFG